MRVNIVVAMAENGTIGRGGGLPWHIPADLRRFREITWGHPLIMGRRTHESIGRALPGRSNIVITGNRDAVSAGCTVVESFAAALDAAQPAEECMVIGGAAVYAAALASATRMFITEVHAAVPGDVQFPPFDRNEWTVNAEEFHRGEGNYDFSFVVLERRQHAIGR